MRIQAPAKVNLTLRVLGARKDGFHDIETLMAPISLADEIDISVVEGTGVELLCDDPAVPCDERNLAARAANAFGAYIGQTFRTKIHLKKNIPVGAGLGGGSSDAAAVLLALNTVCSAHLNLSELELIAGTLGCDVPFFIHQVPAVCRGRGDSIESTKVNERPLLLVKPPFPVPTAWAYQAWDTCEKLGSTENQFLSDIKLINDLEHPVFSKYVLLAVLKDWLRAQPEVEGAMMSGSGSTVFAILGDVSHSLIQKIHSAFGASMWTHFCEIKNSL